MGSFSASRERDGPRGLLRHRSASTTRASVRSPGGGRRSHSARCSSSALSSSALYGAAPLGELGSGSVPASSPRTPWWPSAGERSRSPSHGTLSTGSSSGSSSGLPSLLPISPPRSPSTGAFPWLPVRSGGRHSIRKDHARAQSGDRRSSHAQPLQPGPARDLGQFRPRHGVGEHELPGQSAFLMATGLARRSDGIHLGRTGSLVRPLIQLRPVQRPVDDGRLGRPWTTVRLPERPRIRGRVRWATGSGVRPRGEYAAPVHRGLSQSAPAGTAYGPARAPSSPSR